MVPCSMMAWKCMSQCRPTFSCPPFQMKTFGVIFQTIQTIFKYFLLHYKAAKCPNLSLKSPFFESSEDCPSPWCS